MAVDHLIFNKLKWFSIADNTQEVNANGQKYYKVGSVRNATFKAVKNEEYYTDGLNTRLFDSALRTFYDETTLTYQGKVIGVVNWNNTNYYIFQFPNAVTTNNLTKVLAPTDEITFN